MRPRDALYVAANLRMADRREIEAFALLTPERAMEVTAAGAVAAFTGRYRGQVACVFGVNRKHATSPVGVPWLLGTPLVEKAGPAFLWRSRRYVDAMVERFPNMENWVHADNRAAIDWLRWLGFAMEEPKPFGVLGEPFIRFTMGQP
jgi:hypothetical protein